MSWDSAERRELHVEGIKAGRDQAAAATAWKRGTRNIDRGLLRPSPQRVRIHPRALPDTDHRRVQRGHVPLSGVLSLHRAGQWF